jgi:peptidase S24-like protein
MVDQRQRWMAHAVRATFDGYRQQGASAWIKAQGPSMRPSIAPGAQLLVEFGAAPTSTGAIVVFEQGDRLIAHRLVAYHPDGRLIAKGDAEAFCDAPIAPNDILGVARALRPGPNGPATEGTCAGWPARSIACASRWSGRAAAGARRAGAFLPDPLRRMALRAIPLLARVVALALFAPIGWAAQIHAVIKHGTERR